MSPAIFMLTSKAAANVFAVVILGWTRAGMIRSVLAIVNVDRVASFDSINTSILRVTQRLSPVLSLLAVITSDTGTTGLAH